MISPNSSYFDIGDRISRILKEIATDEVEREHPEVSYVRAGTRYEKEEIQKDIDNRFNLRAHDFCEWLVDSYLEVADDGC